MANWISTEKTYEGFPLLLRRPVKLDIESLRIVFPDLVVPDADLSAILDSILHRYSSEKLSLSIEKDPEWNFIKKYSKDIF